MHIFVDALLPCARTASWPHDKSCHLLSDSLGDLHSFACSIGLHQEWLRWSSRNVPHFDLTAALRLKAMLRGALEITREDASALTTFWHDRTEASLARLLAPTPYFAARLAHRPALKPSSP